MLQPSHGCPSGAGPALVLLHGQVQLELRRELLLRIEPVGEVDPPDAAVGVDLHPESLHIVRPVRAPGEVCQVELDLVPPVVQPHGHGADEGLDSSRRLVVGGAEAAAHRLVVQDLHLEGEVLLHVLDNHDQVGELDAQGLARVGRAGDVRRAHVGAHHLQNEGLDVGVGYTLDVAVADLLVPNLKGKRTRSSIATQRHTCTAQDSRGRSTCSGLDPML